MRVRFFIDGQPVQDHEMPAVPAVYDTVELTLPDGTPVPFAVTEVTWTPHNVIPADVVVQLVPVTHG